MSVLMDPKFYENDFMATNEDELQYMRSPFYEFARKEQMQSKEEAEKLMEDIAIKLTYTEGLTDIVKEPKPNKERKAYTRYAD